MINYRSFKHFSNKEFRKSLIGNLSNQIYVNNDDGFNRFCKISFDTLNSFAPIKNKFVRANQIPFITKELSRKVMKRLRLRSNLLRKKIEENRKLYPKQKNKCVSLLKKAKKEYYQNLDEKNVIDNKKFWKTVKPLLSDKSVSREKINLTENEKMLTSESETAETLNNFFSNIVKKLNIPKFNSNNSVTENIKNPVFKSILNYKNHPSILAIQKYSKNKSFHFEEVNIGEVEKEILKLDKTKGLQKADIPTRIIKEITDIFVDFLCTSINSAIESSSFPSSLKLADVTHA